mgnify:FL=1
MTMPIFTRFFLLLFLFVSSASSVQASSESQPYPPEYWAIRSAINNAQLSPDGKYLALMTIPSRNGDPIIEVYETDNLQADPFRVDADPMEITSFYWAGNETIIFSLRQKVRERIDGFNEGVYESKIALLDLKKKKLKTFNERNPYIVDLLPSKPDKIIISFAEGGGDGPGSKVKGAFRPSAYWEFDLKKGSKKLLIRGKISLGGIDFDDQGNPWAARGYDIATSEYLWYYRAKGSADWQLIHRQHEDNFEEFSVVGKDPELQDHLLVLAHNGNDKIGLWSFDAKNNKFAELVYRRSDVDVYSVKRHSNTWTKPDLITAVVYYKDAFHSEYFDPEEGALEEQLKGIIPHAHTLRINSRSRDGSSMTIYNAGPRDPGTYFLLKGGILTVVGTKQPLLASDQLADVEYINYKARDGKIIPGFITIPNSKPPYPLVVLPHGGPFVQEVVVFDEWSQMLANNGYLVFQPQYRGSLGYGLDFYQSAFMKGGQGGYKMQDDKDDGAQYLVDKGLVDPTRMAMFGWSYGGYAALVAAARTPQLYQCVIAGAAVSDPLMQINYYRFLMRGASKEEQLRMWDDSVSPLLEAGNVNVPMLLIHGDVDQRVPLAHADKYRKALDENKKTYKYVELKGADHFSSTLFFDHKLTLYSALIEFLSKDCFSASAG